MPENDNANEKARVRAGLAALLFFPILEMADTVIALLRGWYPTSWVRLLPASVCLIAIIILTSLTWLRLVRRALARFFAPLMLVTLSLAFAALAGELILLIPALDPIPPFHLRAPGTAATFDPSPAIMPGVTGPTRFTLNSRSFRGPEMPDDPKVVRFLAVGGSTTECFYLDDDRTWTAQLARKLRERNATPPAWVGGAGYSGYASAHHLAFVKRLRAEPRIDEILFLMGVNDMWITLAGRMPRLERSVRNEGIDPWIYRSRLVRKLITGLAPFLIPADIQNEDRQGRIYEVRREERQRATKTDALPDLNQSLEGYAANVRAIIAECRKHGMRPVFLTQPVLWTEHPAPEIEHLLWYGWTSEGSYLTAGSLRQAMDQFNARLVKTCDAAGAQVIDLAASMNGNAAFFYDDCHLNDAGARRIAEIVAGTIVIGSGVPAR